METATVAVAMWCTQGALAPDSHDVGKEIEGVVCQWDGCQQGGRGRKEWDRAAAAHRRKTKREGAPVSPHFAGQGLWLGLPFEHVVSFADEWMGAGTWGWCNELHNIRRHKRHEDVNRNQCGGPAAMEGEVDWEQGAGGPLHCGVIVASMHELQWSNAE